MVNPLTRCVEEYSLPPYAKMKSSDIAPALRTAIEELYGDLASIEEDLSIPEAEMTWSSVMDRLEIIDDPLNRLWAVVSHLCSTMNTPELRATHAEMQSEVTTVLSRRAQSAEIFHALESLRHSDEWNSHPQRILDKAILKATLSGVKLTGDDKEKYNAIELRQKELKTMFANNLLDATQGFVLIINDRHELDGLPSSTLSLLSQNAIAAGYEHATSANGPWKLSLEQPVLTPVLKYCHNRKLRETLYRASVSRACSDPYNNRPVLQEIINLRYERAKLLGFNTYADLSMQDKMASSVSEVEEMFNSLCKKSHNLATHEYAGLQAYATSHGHISSIEPWDTSYWTERIRKDEYCVGDELIKPYFPLQKVLDGMFELARQLFGVQVENLDGLEETWHPDVRYFQIRALEQPDQPIVAQFFLDPFTRPSQKRQGSWVNVVVSRSRVLRTEKAAVRLPVFNIVLNQTPPVENTPSLMTFDDVGVLFRSFGYGLRTALTSAEYTAASASSGVEWDAEVVPSLLFGNFCFDQDVIDLISEHYETGQKLPRDLFNTLVATRQFMACTGLLRQLHLAATDMALHNRNEIVSDTIISTIKEEISERYCLLPLLPEDDFLCQFTHLFNGNYAAGYYRQVLSNIPIPDVARSYKWAEVLSADAYSCFTEAKESTNEWLQVGRRFRDTMLKLVGIHHPMEMFERFRGRKPRIDALFKQYGFDL